MTSQEFLSWLQDAHAKAQMQYFSLCEELAGHITTLSPNEIHAYRRDIAEARGRMEALEEVLLAHGELLYRNVRESKEMIAETCQMLIGAI